MSGGLLSVGGLALFDDYEDATTLQTASFDKLDVTAFNGNALYQVRTIAGDWQPVAGMLCRAGLFKSVPGFSDVFPPGPIAVRFKRATPGIGSTVDVDVYAPDGT